MTDVIHIPSTAGMIVLKTNRALTIDAHGRIREAWEAAWHDRAPGRPALFVLPYDWDIEIVAPREMVEGDL